MHNYQFYYIYHNIYIKLKEAVEIYKNQRKFYSVLAKIYKVYFTCTPKWDAFENNCSPVLSIMECYKPNR